MTKKKILLPVSILGSLLICSLAFASNSHSAAQHAEALPSFFEFLAEKKIYWINFIVYVALLFFVLKKVFLKAWGTRRSAYKDAITSGQKLLEESERTLAEAQSLMASLPNEVSSLKLKMSQEAEYEAESIVRDASQRAEKIKNQASQSAAAEKRAAISQYQEKLIDMAMKNARNKVSGLISADVDSRLKNRVVASIDGLLN